MGSKTEEQGAIESFQSTPTCSRFVYMGRGPSERVTEFRRGWRIVAAAGAGAGLGISGLLTYNSGLFVNALEKEIGLTRGAFGLAFFGATLAMALSLPWVGRWIDQRGPAAPALGGSLLLAIGFVGLATLNGSVATYTAWMIAIGLFAVGSGPISYNRAVSTSFSAGRGLALGLTQVGIGVSAAAVPPMVTAVMVNYGWRSGFLVLAVLALLGCLPAVFIRRAPDGPPAASDAPPFWQVAKSRLFLHQMAAFVVMALGFAGLLPHFVPLLRDAGLSAQTAAGYASLIGVFVILSRVVVGWLADFVHAPWLAAAACLLCAIGCGLLAVGGPTLAAVGAAALGCAMGAEADLVGFMTARHFGVAVFGRAYAWQYSGFMLAAGVGPAWVGYVRDTSGNYEPALMAASVMMVAASILFLTLPRVADVGRASD